MNSITDRFLVIRKSKNTNSFGLLGLWIVNKQGKVFEFAMNPEFAPNNGAIVNMEFAIKKLPNGEQVVRPMPMACDGHIIEIPERKPDCPPDVLKAIEDEFNVIL